MTQKEQVNILYDIYERNFKEKMDFGDFLEAMEYEITRFGYTEEEMKEIIEDNIRQDNCNYL